MSYLLYSAVWELTGRCCFQCEHCGSGGNMPNRPELDTQQCLDIVSQLVDLSCQRISLIGGEVFMRDDWPLIVESLTRGGIRTCIVTNGYLISPAVIKQLRQVKCESVAVSLDGTEKTHDSLRQHGSFTAALQALELLHKSQIPASVITTLNAINQHQLDDLYQILQQSGIFAWQLQACTPMGNALHGFIDPAFDFGRVLDFVRSHLKTAPFALGVADNIGYHSEDDGQLRGNANGGHPFNGCHAGLSTLGIDSTGNVRGCESLRDDRFIEGSLLERSLQDIWEDPNAFAYNRQFSPAKLTGVCAHCSKGPWCAGGCRSYAYFSTGNLYENPACVFAQS